MGIYYTATTAIGYEISTANTYVVREEPNCPHEHNAKFCPECGRPQRTNTYHETKDQYDEFRDEFVNNLPDEYVFKELYDGSGDKFWIGYGAQSDDDEPVRVDPKPYEEIKAELRQMLEPFTSTGLIEIDETKFGIWTIYAGA